MNVAANIFKYSRCCVKHIRCSSTLRNSKHHKMTAAVSISKLQEEKTHFYDALPEVIDTLTSNSLLNEVPEVAKWVKKVLDYNMCGGKNIRGLTTVFAYEMLEKPENINEESLKLARIMGWCIEILQVYLLVLDDIMDRSTTRRGVPCWSTLPEVGMGAINDCVLIHTSIFYIIKTYFANRPHYANLLEHFNESLMYTSMGQHLDYAITHRNKDDYSLFTIDRYNTVVKYKTAIYTIKMPVCTALYLANNTNKETLKKVHDISIKIGSLFQVQDDYIDCFGDESVTGKAGTDIQEGKCTWLAVTALQRCTAPQRVVFTACYGSNEPAHVERIKELYRQLGIPQLYAHYERRQYEDIQRQAREIADTTDIPAALFHRILDMLYHRTK